MKAIRLTNTLWRKAFEIYYNWILLKNLPDPNAHEIYCIDLLRDRYNKFKIENGDSLLNATELWNDNRILLHKLVHQNDPRNFLKWEIINYTMYSEPSIEELNEIRKSKHWNSLSLGLNKRETGKAKPYYAYPKSNGNLIHQTYNYLQLLHAFPNFKIEDIEFIFEFGGGYGCMCRLLHNLGFKGTYIIFDFPEFLALQEFYLMLSQIDSTIHFCNYSPDLKGIRLISDQSMLNNHLKNIPEKSLFIATWSLSETPINFRNEILLLTKDINYYLLAFQNNFQGNDNIKFFDDFKKNCHSHSFFTYPIKHLDNNWYMVGNKIKRGTNE